MNYTEGASGPLVKVWEFFVTSDEMNSLFDAELIEKQKKASMPGFRPGKIPLNLIRKFNGDEALTEVIRERINQSCNYMSESINKSVFNIRAIVDTNPNLSLSEGMKYRVVIELLPQVPKVELNNLALDNYKVNLSDEEIQEFIEDVMVPSILQRSIEGPIKEHDLVVLNIIPSRLDDSMPNRLSNFRFRFRVGSSELVQDLSSKILGMKKDEQRKFTLLSIPRRFLPDIPKDFQETHLSLECEAKVLSIYDKTSETDINDIMAKLNLSDLSQLKEKASQDLTKEIDFMLASLAKYRIIKHLSDQAQFDLPPGMVRNAIVAEAKMRSSTAQGGKTQELNKPANSEGLDKISDHDTPQKEESSNSQLGNALDSSNPDAQERDNQDQDQDLVLDSELEPVYGKTHPLYSIVSKKIKLGLVFLEFSKDNGLALSEEEVAASVRDEVIHTMRIYGAIKPEELAELNNASSTTSTAINRMVKRMLSDENFYARKYGELSQERVVNHIKGIANKKEETEISKTNLENILSSLHSQVEVQ